MVEVVAAAARGGVTMVQLRSKNAMATPEGRHTLLNQARALQALLRPLHIPFLINDYPDIAAEIGADGVHLGQGDGDPAAARALLGPDAIIGVTAFTPAHFAAIDPDVLDYTGTGPVYPTKTDKGKPVLGPGKFAELIKLSLVPVVGIGGITPENAPPVLEAGAAGVAMIRAISAASDPEGAARQFSGLSKRASS